MKYMFALFLALAPAATLAQTCGGGNVGDGICADSSLCCSSYGWCGSSAAHCSNNGQPSPTPPTTTPGGGATPGGDGDSRMIAYMANWMDCPSPQQLAQYTHVVIAFAVTYTWNPTKNVCDSSCTISEPPVCNNKSASAFIQEMHSAGKKVILSFGGAGMGGSWAGDVNDCWEDCFGKEEHVVNQLATIVRKYNYDGVDIDYEYFYETSAAQNFLTQVTTGLRQAMPAGNIVTHAPMDIDLLPGSAYFSVLKNVAESLDFLMPQYYNGVTRPVADGVGGTGAGSVAALDHFNDVSNQIFGGDPTKIVFGFCINDCSATGSNANGNQAAGVMSQLASHHSCNGGAFFWVAHDDAGGAWSSTVNKVVQANAGCSAIGPTPIPPTPAPPTPNPPTPSAPTPTPGTCGNGSVGNGICADGTCCSGWGYCGCSSGHCINGQICGGGPAPTPTLPPPTTPAPPVPTTPSPTTGGTCGNGSVGNGICADGTCCSGWGYCGCTSDHCINGQICGGGPVVGTCGGGSVGNGICPDPSLCCSSWGYCGSSSAYCN